MAIVIKKGTDGDSPGGNGAISSGSDDSSNIVKMFSDNNYEEAIIWFKKYIAKEENDWAIRFFSEELPYGKHGFPAEFPRVVSSDGYSWIEVVPTDEEYLDEEDKAMIENSKPRYMGL